MKVGDIVFDDLTFKNAVILGIIPIECGEGQLKLHGKSYIIVDSPWLNGVRYEWEVTAISDSSELDGKIS